MISRDRTSRPDASSPPAGWGAWSIPLSDADPVAVPGVTSGACYFVMRFRTTPARAIITPPPKAPVRTEAASE